jgi:hypothetical protein
MDTPQGQLTSSMTERLYSHCQCQLLGVLLEMRLNF